MAYNLGNHTVSPRNFAIGAYLIKHFSPGTTPDAKQQEVDTAIETANQSIENLFTGIRDEIQSNYNTILRLSKTRRLPKSERENFNNFMTRWIEFGQSRNGAFTTEDIEQLNSFKKENDNFTQRLAKHIAVLSAIPTTLAVSQTASRTPTTNPSEITEPPKPMLSNTVIAALAVGSVAAAAAIVSIMRKK
jgi:hypothetical protein